MSARSFRPVFAVATVAAAALSCYLVSLRVATERSSLEDIETKIVLAQRDIRALETEIGTRGRLEQLERWNVKVLALSAPNADQFVDGGYQLARLARPTDEAPIDAPVVLASAPKPAPAAPLSDDRESEAAVAPRPVPRTGTPASIMHVASYSVTMKEAKPAAPTVTKPAAKPATKITMKTGKIASTDRLAALPSAKNDAKASPHRTPAKTGTTRDSGTHQ